MTDEPEGRIDRRTLLRLDGLVSGGFALDGVGPVEVGETDRSGQTDRTERTVGANQEDVPDIAGFHPVHVNGMLYGEGDEEPPDGLAGEWADARGDTVDLVGAGDATTVESRLRRKVVGNDLYFGLYVPPEEREQTEALSADQLSQLRVFLDRDGTGEVTDGDARLVGEFVDDPTEEQPGTRWEVQVFDGGEFVETEVGDDVPPASAGVSNTEEGGLGVEGRIDQDALDEILDEGSSESEVNINVELLADEFSWGVGYNPAEASLIYQIPGVALTPVDPRPLDNTSVDHIEVTQAVQTPDNSLPLARGKETLVRVFVDHPESEAIEVDVELQGYRLGPSLGLRGGFPFSPLWELGFDAPPQPLDREKEEHSANIRLPDDWTNVQGLLLVARVSRPGHVDIGTEDRSDNAVVTPEATYDPTIWFNRVDEAMTPGRPSLTERKAVQKAFTEVMPIANPTFPPVGSPRLQDVEGDDNLIARLDLTARELKQINDTVDHVYGLTQDYPGLAGLSSPSWNRSGPDNHLAAWGDIMNDGGYPTLMGHEVNHNIGGNNWAWHCQDDDSFDNDCVTGEVGWSPTYGIIPTDMTELMNAGTISNSGPRKWVSAERWKLLFDRFQNFIPGEPQPPGFGGPSTSANQAGTEQTHPTDDSTVRIITGALYPNGGGYLNPSFEIPGETTEPAGDDENPNALLRVEYTESTLTIPFEKSFEPLHGETVDESAFSFVLPDGGDIEAVRLLDAGTEDQLDAYEATGFELDSASVETPDAFQRGQDYEVTVDVQTDSDATLYRQLRYSPDDGETWLPYSETFTGNTQQVFFSDGPGGDSARFMLLVSDGIQTERVESSSFEVPSLPPTVEISGAHEWAVEDGDLQDVAEPVDAIVGSEVTLRAGVTDQFGEELSGDAIEWSVVDEAGESVPITGSAVGERFRHRFTRQETFTVTATGTDPATGMSATDEIQVVVGRPPLPSQDAVDQFQQREPGSAGVVLAPSSQTIQPGGTRSFDVVVVGADAGVGAFELAIETATPEVAKLVDYELSRETELADVELAADGSTVEFSVALADNVYEPGDVTLATITVEGTQEDEAALELIAGEVTDANDPLSYYDIAKTRGAEVTVSTAVGPPPVVTDDPPQDDDGDGLYEDFDGDEAFTLGDVQQFFENRNADVVQNNAAFFNFSGTDPDEVTIADVKAHFEMLVESNEGASESLGIGDPTDLSAEALAAILADR
jgi:hypothetical protein